MITKLTLLLVTQVAAEWVEISQQHYRKPMRTHNPFITPDKVIDVEETAKHWTYNNYSITEHNWNKYPARSPNIGNVKRVQPTVTVKSNERKKFEAMYPDLDADITDYEIRPIFGTTKATNEFNDNEKLKGTIERVSNVGNVKRVQPYNISVKSPAIHFKGDGNINSGDSFETYSHEDMVLTEENEFENEKSTETVNLGTYNKKVKKHHNAENMGKLLSDPNAIFNIKGSEQVESSDKNIQAERDKSSKNGYKNNLHNNAPQIEEEFENKQVTAGNNQRIYINNVKENHGTFASLNEDKPLIEDATIVYGNKKILKPEYKNDSTINKNLHSRKPTFIAETENSKYNETQENQFYKITNGKTSEATEKQKIFTTQNIYTNEDIVTDNKQTTNKPTVEQNVKSNNYKNNLYVSEPDSQENKFHLVVNDEEQTDGITNDLKTHTTTNNGKPEQDSQFGKIQQKELEDKNKETSKEAKKGGNKVNTIENIVKFMRVVADTISRNSRRSFGGKVQYLQELKDSILANIDERIDSSWPDDDMAGAHRRSRSAHASPRGSHVQFPSSESSLMTISFLTFAVFLIKLVLQVIQTYKNKTMMVAPLVVASAGRNMFTLHGHY